MKILKTCWVFSSSWNNHDFAIWDFMSLLKAQQRSLTCIEVSWLPSEKATARFINEIVLEKASDINEKGEPSSHFEMYLDAMCQIETKDERIVDFVRLLRSNMSISDTLTSVDIPQGVRNFVSFMFYVIKTNEPHVIASAFTFGGEDVIPDMFMSILKRADPNHERYNKLAYYLQRHIELNVDDHGLLSLQMIKELCGDSDKVGKRLLLIARESLRMRIELWNSINGLLINREKQLELQVS